jgi:undecaprenyl-diphosphatase
MVTPGIWMAGLWADLDIFHSAWHRNAALLGIGVGVLAVLVLAIKFSVRRQRPRENGGAIYRNTDPHSFPSGHAARAAMLAVYGYRTGASLVRWTMLVWCAVGEHGAGFDGCALSVGYSGRFDAGCGAGFGMLELAPWLVSWIPFLF